MKIIHEDPSYLIIEDNAGNRYDIVKREHPDTQVRIDMIIEKEDLNKFVDADDKLTSSFIMQLTQRFKEKRELFKTT